MKWLKFSALFAILCPSLLIKRAQCEKVLRIKPFEATEEERESSFLGKHLECDGCHVMSYQIITTWNKLKSKKSSKEYDYFEALEELCEPKRFKSYGLVSVNDQTRITGPGTESDGFFVQMGGALLHQLSTFCWSWIQKEEELYKIWGKDPSPLGLRSWMCDSFCKRDLQDLKQN
nr:uncharacterized protein LOC121120345 [Lepeophtheirus salmonis]